MAENVTLAPIATLQNSSIIATVNANNDLIEEAFSDCLSIVGNQPNAMQSNLDMNGQQIINLPAPSTLDSPLRLVDFQGNTGQVIINNITEILGGTAVTPEQFGAIGNGTVDDTNAIQAMTAAGRVAGSLYVELTHGKTYTCTNPMVFGAIPYLRIEGNGANWMNPRGTSAPINTFLENYQPLVLGPGPFFTDGPFPFASQQNFGVKINTTTVGATSITTIDGSPMPTGRILIYGLDRQGSDSNPPCANCFEYNEVLTASGATGTLTSPTKYAYDAQWPETSVTVHATFTGAIAGNILTASAVSGTITLNDTIGGTTVPIFSRVLNQLTGSVGGAGTYTLTNSFPVAVTAAAMSAIVGNVYGAPRVLSCEGINGTGRVAVVKNVNFLPNPNWTDTSQPSFPPLVNGSIQISGYDEVYWSGNTASAYGISVARTVTMDNETVRNIGGLSGNPQIEIDKLVDYVKIRNMTVDEVTSAFGTKRVYLEDCNIWTGMSINPIEFLSLSSGVFTGNDISSHSLIGLFNQGPRKLLIENSRHIVTDSLSNAWLQQRNLALTIDVSVTAPVTKRGTITVSRTNYNSSHVYGSMFVGAVFRNAAGLPAFKVTRQPYTTGDPFTGNVSIDGDFFTTITNGNILYIPSVWDVEIRTPTLDGPFQSNVTCTFTNAPGATTPLPSPKIRDKYIKDGSITITSDMCYLNMASNLYVMYLGHPFIPESAVIMVSDAATSGTLALKYIDPSGTSNTLFNSVDLTTVGRRIIDRSAVTTLGGDSNTTGSLGLTAMSELSFQDTSASLNQPGPAQWSVTFYGTWLPGYGGTN